MAEPMKNPMLDAYDFRHDDPTNEPREETDFGTLLDQYDRDQYLSELAVEKWEGNDAL